MRAARSCNLSNHAQLQYTTKTLRVECQRCIERGTVITFYHPLYFGSFQISVYCTEVIDNTTRGGQRGFMYQANQSYVQLSNEKKKSTRFGVVIHENGEVVDPTTDERFEDHVTWLQGGGPWQNRTYTAETIADQLSLLNSCMTNM
mmetsp:Transcript_5263/g.5724  ORF Transcript_5263/g.5724 Transcript_5263/m.5724 type:complete len:146 (+) Transcript_5263:114-551(+)